MRYVSFFARHGIFFCILAIATILRLHDISRQMILIGDQGRDFFVARAMVLQGEIPLLGIPSSVPRFAQGPLYIYILALIYWLSSGSVVIAGISAGLFGVSAIIALYLLVGSYLNWRVATLTCALFSFLPMLLLHSRMPYHINPIPLFTVLYLWQLLRFWEGKKWSSFTVGLGFALLFQFELAAFALLLLIPIVILLRVLEETQSRSWRVYQQALVHDPRVEKLALLAGTLFGLLPQVIHDFTHGFSQLGGFLLWVGYRLTSAVLPYTRNSFFDQGSATKVYDLFSMYVSIFTQNGYVLDTIFWGLLIPLSAIILGSVWNTLRRVEKLALVTYLLLVGSFLIHRVPSEAYMPIIAPPAILVLSWGIIRLRSSLQFIVLGLLTVSLVFSVWQLERNHFYLLQPHESNWSERRFGPSLQTQRLVVNTLYRLSKERCIKLESSERERTFPTTFAHIEYLLAIDGVRKNGPCVRIRIDKPSEAARLWQSTADSIDLGVYWVQLEEHATRFTYKTAL